jgi:hypothetical protein
MIEAGLISGFLDGLVSLLLQALNAVLAGLGLAVNGVISAWPVGMPSLPAMPSQVGTAIQWIRWSPFPLDALAAFFTFSVSVFVAYMVARPVLRWLKVDD